MIEPFHIQCESQSDDLYLFFSGLNRHSETAVFEFTRSTRELTANKIYIRDPFQLWYQAGFPDKSTNVKESAQQLQTLISQIPANRIIACGNSMGGYAAILFGWLLQVDEVHAFSPKSVISPWKRLLLLDIGIRAALLRRDPFLVKRIWALHRQPNTCNDYLDLRKTLRQPNGRSQYHLYYAGDSRRERFQSTRLAKLPGIHLHAHRHDRHDLVKVLKREGKLLETFHSEGSPGATSN